MIELDPRLPATIALIRRISDDIVWTVSSEGQRRQEVGVGGTPAEAAFGLARRLIDTGVCHHCHRPTRFSPDFAPVDTVMCLYQWQPALDRFTRGCAA